MRRRGAAGFAADVVRRFRGADGTSHTRALAFQSVFVLISSYIGVVGLASVSGTFAMAQFEPSANRIFGSSQDRPGIERYAGALVLAATGGMVLAVGALIMGGGRAVAEATGRGSLWTIGRWPIGVTLATAGVFLLFRTAPRGRPAPAAELASGVLVAVVLWSVFAILLGLYFGWGAGSNAYGPLIAVIALLLWSLFSSAALHLGLAVAAELADAARPGTLVRVPDAQEPVASGDRGS